MPEPTLVPEPEPAHPEAAAAELPPQCSCAFCICVKVGACSVGPRVLVRVQPALSHDSEHAGDSGPPVFKNKRTGMAASSKSV